MRCICLPEMKKGMYKMELALNNLLANITHAKCDCPAGAGPLGSCKHIAAFCYALEEFSRIRCVRDPESCTSQLQEWK